MLLEREGYASRIANWQEACGGLPISQQFDKLKEETTEAVEPIILFSAPQLDQLPQTDPELSEHVARECVDVAIVAIGIVGLLGHNFDELFHETVDKMHAKYPPERIKEMRALGLTTQAVLKLLKDEWNANGGAPSATTLKERKRPAQYDDEIDYDLLLTNAGALY